MLALAWHYLTGRAVATDPSDRQTAEWPPHPDRVFMALVAAWGESGADAASAAALDWLAALPPPALHAPDAVHAGATPKVYVPVNDLEGAVRRDYGDGLLGLLPERRTRKERWFPATVVGDGACILRWDDADAGEHLAALTRLAAAVTHIGHSSSLVRMWIEPAPPPATWVPVAAGQRRDCALRVPEAGRRAVLVAAYADGVTGWQRPPTGPWHGYIRVSAATGIPRGAFDDRLVILRRVGGDAVDLRQAGAYTAALRGALMKAADGQAEVLAAVSGHQADGKPAEMPHVAYLPLPFVGEPGAGGGHGHADGHLLGFALALPRDLPPALERGIHDALLCAFDDETGALKLAAGADGACSLVIEDRPAPAQALRSATWCRPSTRWSTVTPIALDRFPPRRHADAEAFAAGTIAEACARQGLPRPERVAILDVPAVLGAPRARDFPPLTRKTDGARRWMVHADIVFPVAVSGPVLLGAGRYRGYGLCRPMSAP